MTLRCLICNRKAERCHIKTRAAGAGWNDNEWLPLCRRHHIEQHSIGWKTLSDKYPGVIHELEKRGWKLANMFGIWKMVRR